MRNWIFGQLDCRNIIQNIGVDLAESSLLNQTVWHAQDAAATNSASVVDKVKIGCFFEDQDTVLIPL